jgi:hypothetical protein
MDTNVNNYISIKEIVDNLMRYPSMRDLDYDSAIAWAVWVMGIVGSYDLYKDDTDIVTITNNRGLLPKGIIKVEQCRKINGTPEQPSYVSMLTATDPFHVKYNNYQRNYREEVQKNMYKIQGDYIYTEFPEGMIEIAFKTLYTDDDGVIMLPTNTSLTKAVEAYIKQEHFRGLFEIGKIERPIFEEAKGEYTWYIAQAQNSVMNVSLDERQSISNAAHRLMWNEDYHDTGFKNVGDKEYLRRTR